jgi:hypothetical protein
MRKSIIAGLTLCAALAVVGGQAQASSEKDGMQGTYRHNGHKAKRVAETPAPGSQFRIPANPVVRDCVHVMFPQCARGYDGLNDGTFNQPYK